MRGAVSGLCRLPVHLDLQTLRVVFDNVSACVFTKDLRGRYTYANQAVCQLLGRSLDGIMGKSNHTFFTPDCCAHLDEAERAVLRTGAVEENEEVYVFKDHQSSRVFWTVMSPIVGLQGEIIGLCGIASDVTERKHFEMQQDQYRELLDTVLGGVDAYIYMKDQERRYLYVNPKLAQLYEHSCADIIGHTDAELFRHEVAERFQAIDEQVFKTGQRYTGLERFIDQEGQTHFFWVVKFLLRRHGQKDCLIGLSSNVTEFQDAEAALRISEAHFRALFETTNEASFVLDANHFIDCNDAVLQIFGLPDKAAFKRQSIESLSPPLQPSGLSSAMQISEYMDAAVRNGSIHFGWTFCRADNQRCFPCDVMLNAVLLNGVPSLMATMRDATERMDHEAQMSRMAFYDALTQLPNRHLACDRLAKALEHCKRSGRHGALIFLDMDNFKTLNDEYGHAIGDKLLQEVAYRLQQCLRTEDTCARQGGDEFIVLLTDLDESAEEARVQMAFVAEKIRTRLADPYFFSSADKYVAAPDIKHNGSASIGATLISPGESNPEHIMLRADTAMYQAKRAGGNAVFTHLPSGEDMKLYPNQPMP